ncbi:MAG: hypothetical protein CVU96_00305 [Firmicutes bacterium HGW-Firmicutes-20]|nr:MAG: hypothetical protein CVU96_00305 [Firmicutes bacterium HGW-Firmicutes-20]PKM70231.1 MAG: hypothetical protein CVU94_00015 [Firmicutes bacterium HGW-Firmicutes-19]
MGKLNLSSVLKKSLLIILGIVIAAFGIAMTYKTGIGTNPMATASDGITKVLPLNYGYANLLLNFIFLVVAFFVKREKINLGTLLMVLTMGIFINLFTGLLVADVPFRQYQLMFNVLGTIITSLGIAIVVLVDFGIGPYDLMTEVIIDKLKCSYRMAKIIADSSLLVVGIMMGGVFGLGTVGNVILVGIFIQLFIELARKSKLVLT